MTIQYQGHVYKEKNGNIQTTVIKISVKTISSYRDQINNKKYEMSIECNKQKTITYVN